MESVRFREFSATKRPPPVTFPVDFIDSRSAQGSAASIIHDPRLRVAFRLRNLRCQTRPSRLYTHRSSAASILTDSRILFAIIKKKGNFYPSLVRQPCRDVVRITHSCIQECANIMYLFAWLLQNLDTLRTARKKTRLCLLKLEMRFRIDLDAFCSGGRANGGSISQCFQLVLSAFSSSYDFFLFLIERRARNYLVIFSRRVDLKEI